MPIALSHGQSVVLIRRDAFETHSLLREAIDNRYGLTPDEFRVEEDLIAIGPLPADDALTGLLADLESEGLVYFDDFFELSGNWPEWLSVYVRAPRGSN